MSREDYVIDAETSTVLFKGEAVASFNSVTGDIIEYLADGSKRKRWIKEALDKSDSSFEPEVVITDEDVEEVQGWRKDFYEVFPDAPKPKDNKVGYCHQDIANWVKAKYPKFYDLLYPFGVYDPVKAGVEGNLTHPKGGKATAIEMQG
jgi:hypothetical protein